MALQVWLPLAKDNLNQGLDDLQPTNLGTVSFIDGGKLGKCLSAGTGTQTTNGISYPTNLVSELGTQFSCAIWVRPLGNHVHYNGTFISSGNWNTKCWSFGVSQDNTKVDIFSKGHNRYLNCEVPVNTWTHLCCTSDNGTVKLYKNGIYVGQATGVPESLDSDATNFCVGRETYASGYFSFNGNINDVRIYDHALSPKEVKLISQGLVAHYQLNNLNGQENLFTWQNKGDEVITLNNYSSTGSFTQFSNSLTFDPSTTVGQKYTISFWARSPNGKTDLRIYNQNGSPRYFKFTSVTLTTDLNAEWQYFTHTVTNSDVGSGDTTDAKCRRIEIYAPSKMGVQVKKIKIENGETATIWSPAPSDSHYSDLGYNDTTVHDTSGYGYNGVNYSATSSTDSPRCLTSTEFDGSSNYIEFPNLSFMPNMLPNEWTFSFWVYNQDSGGRSILFSDYAIDITGSAFCFEKTTGELLRIGYSGSFDRNIPNSTLTVNAWTHIAVTKTTANLITVYRNGVQIDSYTNANCKSDGVKYRMGRDSRTNSTMFKGKLSDFRIYSTALSADDIQTLYNAPVSITNKGAMTTQGEFNEHTNI